MSFQTNQNAVLVDECREFKIQRLTCRLTFPCPILLAGEQSEPACKLRLRRQDIRMNNTLSEPFFAGYLSSGMFSLICNATL